MQTILRLDVAGQPRGWITVPEAVTAYAKGDVIYGIGNNLAPVMGGTQRSSGKRSRIDLQPIVDSYAKFKVSDTSKFYTPAVQSHPIPARRSPLPLLRTTATTLRSDPGSCTAHLARGHGSLGKRGSCMQKV